MSRYRATPTFDDFCNSVQAELRRLKQKDTFSACEADCLFEAWRKDVAPDKAVETICDERVMWAFGEPAWVAA